MPICVLTGGSCSVFVIRPKRNHRVAPLRFYRRFTVRRAKEPADNGSICVGVAPTVENVFNSFVVRSTCTQIVERPFETVLNCSNGPVRRLRKILVRVPLISCLFDSIKPRCQAKRRPLHGFPSRHQQGLLPSPYSVSVSYKSTNCIAV